MFLKKMIFIFFISSVAFGGSVVTLIDSEGNSDKKNHELSKEELRKGFQSLLSGFLFSISIEAEDEKIAKENIFSAARYNQEVDQETISLWNEMPQLNLPEIPKDFVSENEFFIHPHKDLGKFYFSHPNRKHFILYTTEIANCVAVIGYNKETKQGFLSHIPFWDEDFEKDFKFASQLIQADSALDQVQISMVTSIVSRASNLRLKMIQSLGYPVQVSSFPGIFEELSVIQKDGYGPLKPFLRLYINPEILDFETYIHQFVEIQGRSVYFDTRDGRIYEGQAKRRRIF